MPVKATVQAATREKVKGAPSKRQRKLKPSAAVTRPLDPADPLIAVHKLSQETTGKRPARTSTWRWCSGRGCPRLPAVLVGNQWFTTRTAWMEWLTYRTNERLRRQGVPVDVTPEELADARLD